MMVIFRQGNVRISSAWNIDQDEIVLEVRIPKNCVDRMDRREFADMMYDLMVAPLDEEADKDRALVANHNAMVEREIGKVPPGWYVFWCAQCKYAVTWDPQTQISYMSDWETVLQSAIVHEH
jgi:hypothetical protein